jgi:hypothetical protein
MCGQAGWDHPQMMRKAWLPGLSFSPCICPTQIFFFFFFKSHLLSYGGGPYVGCFVHRMNIYPGALQCPSHFYGKSQTVNFQKVSHQPELNVHNSEEWKSIHLYHTTSCTHHFCQIYQLFIICPKDLAVLAPSYPNRCCTSRKA